MIAQALSEMEALEFALLGAGLAAFTLWGLMALDRVPAHRFRRRIPLAVWVMALAAFSLRGLVAELTLVPSPSMAPAILPGDRLLVLKPAFGLPLPFSERRLLAPSLPQPLELCAFIPPGSAWTLYLKRCMAVPGEVVELKAGRLFVDGREREIPGLRLPGPRLEPKAPPSGPAPLGGNRDHFGPLTVPAGHYLMLGDNRDQSRDSRSFGLVPASRLRGKPVWRYAPARRRGGLR